eukprot:477976-Pyramimonas_sp.AAC.1
MGKFGKNFSAAAVPPNTTKHLANVVKSVDEKKFDNFPAECIDPDTDWTAENMADPVLFRSGKVHAKLREFVAIFQGAVDDKHKEVQANLAKKTKGGNMKMLTCSQKVIDALNDVEFDAVPCPDKLWGDTWVAPFMIGVV